MTPPALLLDADMVLLDYVSQFVRYLEERHGILPAVPWHEEDDYDLLNMYPDHAGRGLRPYMLSMARDPGYYPSIPFLPGVEAAVANLRGRFPGVPFVCVTACGEGAETRAMRIENLAPLGLDDVVTLPLGAAKADALRRFPPGSWFVDDVPRHVLDAEAAGHRGILFHHRYNAAAAVERRAEDWPGVVAIVGGAVPAPPPFAR